MRNSVKRLVLVGVMVLGVCLPVWGAYRIGDSGPDVITIQNRLQYYGYDVTADGMYGSNTAAAVEQFQAAKGLDADGVVGPMTYRTLVGREMEVSRSDAATAVARRIISAAQRFIGVPYVFGGSTPSGFDCSGFIRYVYGAAGISLPRSADEQYNVGYAVNENNLLPGDLVFFSTYEPGVSHSGIYIGGGRFISATTSSGIHIDSLYDDYWHPRFIGAKRIM